MVLVNKYCPFFQGQLRGRAEIAPDQREKFIQRLQQVQQQGHGTLLGMSSLAGGKQFSAAQQNPLLQQVFSVSFSLIISFCELRNLVDKMHF